MADAATADIEAEQAALRRVATLVAEGAPADGLFAAVAADVGRLFGADLASLSRLDRDGAAHAVATWSAGGEHPDAGGGLPSTAASPIAVDGRVWGTLTIQSLSTRFPAGTERRMAAFTELIAIAIANLDARAAVTRLADEQAALRRVATLVGRESPAREVFAAVAEEVGRLFGVSASTVFRFVGEQSAVVVASWGDADALLAVGTRVPLDGDNIAVRIRRGVSSVRIEDPAEVTGAIGEQARRLGTRSGVGAAIVVAGELWGGIVATSRDAEPLPADAETRIAQFTDLVATAISNTEARAELAASRARLVAAADAERRRLIRDLHDGAQQRLVHTVLTLTLARQAVSRSERARALLDEAVDHAQRATAELRELAHGILPSALTHGGLPAAVDALASRMPVPVGIELPAERFPTAVEATAYFVVAEALANVAKHAQAERADVFARVRGGALRVEVRDDGVGGARPDGRGLQGVADRVAAGGGRLEVSSPAGAGTRVAAELPLRAE